MQDKQIIYAPAKLNLFLKVHEKRDDGYHNIRSGITFINLFDVIEIKRSKTMKISYHGPYKPENGFYSNCIIKKTLDFLGLDISITEAQVIAIICILISLPILIIKVNYKNFTSFQYFQNDNKTRAEKRRQSKTKK